MVLLSFIHSVSQSLKMYFLPVSLAQRDAQGHFDSVCLAPGGLRISICVCMDVKWASQVALMVKNSSAKAGEIRAVGSTPRWGRSPGEGNGNPLQYSCLENPIGTGTWRAAIHGLLRAVLS